MEGFASPDRKLAYIVRIDAVADIPKAERVMQAVVCGWKVVIKKNEFNPGDLAVYFEIGSMLCDELPWVVPLNLKGKPLKTKKILGICSQGLLGPLEWLGTPPPTGWQLGDDVTMLTRVQKWIPREEEDLYVADSTRGPFPEFIPRTAEEKVQNVRDVEVSLCGRSVILTQKYDGTSTTMYAVGSGSERKAWICGRNGKLLEPTKATPHYFEIAYRYGLLEKLLTFGRNIALQGEIIGPKINANRHHVEANEFYLFNVYDIERMRYVEYEEMLEIAAIMGVKTIPLVYKGPMKAEWNREELLKLAAAQRYAYGGMAEGLVLKTDDKEPRTSVKIISNQYLMKHDL